MKSSKVILLNGPPGCGKSSLSNYLLDKIPNSLPLTPRDHLLLQVPVIFDIGHHEFAQIYKDRKLKEVPHEGLRIACAEYNKLARIVGKPTIVSYTNETVALSPREAMIFVSEVMVKPVFGDDYYGKVRANKVRLGGIVYIDDSCGFPDELLPLIEKVPQKDILLLRIKGRGEYDGDSRGYIPDGLIDQTLDVYNDSTLHDFVVGTWGRIASFIKA